MKIINPIVLLVYCAMVLISCSSDDNQASNYPKLFLFDSIQMGDYGEYLIGANESYTEINPTTREDLVVTNTEFTLNSFPNLFREFELLDEMNIRVLVGVDTQLVDTVLTYQTVGDFLIVDWLSQYSGARFLEYNSNDEQMYVRTGGDVSLAGPNAVDQIPVLYDFFTFGNADFETLEEHLDFLISENDYAVGDTVIVFEPQKVYQ